MRRVIVAAVIIVVLFGAIWLYARTEYRAALRKAVESAARDEASYISKNVGNRLRFIVKDLLDVYARGLPGSQDEHASKTRHLIAANGFLQTINYIGPDRRIKFVSPYLPNKKVIGLKIEIAAPKRALERALARRRPTLSAPFQIVQGRAGYSLMVPASKGGLFEIVFTAEKVFSKGAGFRHRTDVLIRLRDGSAPVYESPGFGGMLDRLDDKPAKVPIKLFDRPLELAVAPAHGFRAPKHRFWRVLSIGGVAVSLLLLLGLLVLQGLNIRERKRAAEALEASEQKYYKAFMTGPDSIAITRISDGQFVEVNQTLVRTLGYRRDEVIGKTAAELDNWAVPEDRQAFVDTLTEKGECKDLETAFRAKDGRLIPHVIAGTLIDLAGERCVLSIARDMTERKKADEERERLITELQGALAKVKTLHGLIPICASCKNIRDDEGYWHQVETYVRDHSLAEFSHGICPDCMHKLYPNI